MARFCKHCGSLLDEASGKCPNCDKAEITNVNNEIKDSINDISRQKKQKIAKHKGKPLLIKITAIVLALIIASGTVGFLVYQGVFDSDLIKDIFEHIDVNKKVPSIDRNNAETNDSDFTFYKSGDKNIVQDVESGNLYINNELLITLDSINSKDDFELFLSDIGAKIVGEIPAIAEYQVLLDEEYTYAELLGLCSKLQKNDYIISTSLNYVMDTNPSYTPNDKKWNEKWDEVPNGTNWGLEAISATGAWDKKDEMQNINIGVIDTMFDLNHEDLSFAETPLGMAIINSELSKNEREWNNHGTHTSGTIAALFDNEKGIAGIMPKSNLYGVAIWGLESASRTTLQTWKIAFYYLIATNNCKVINISMGYDQLCFNASRGSEAAISATETYSNEIAEYLQILIDSDYEFVICKSAGNQNEVGGGYQYFRKDSDDTNTPYDYYSYSDYVSFLNGEEGYEYLERYKDRQDEIKDRLESGNVSADFDFLAAITNAEVRDRIIIVGAVENQGSHKEGGFLWFGRKTVHNGYKIASFSQCGEAVDVLAPGVDVYSTIQNGYENMSGTSMAAPHVSGVAGLVFAVNPNVDGKTVKEIICSSADGQYGEEKYGLLNAKKAVDTAKSYTEDTNQPDEIFYKYIKDNLTISSSFPYDIQKSNGVFSALIEDFDSDGQKEMLTFSITHNEVDQAYVVIDLYKLKNNIVTLVDTSREMAAFAAGNFQSQICCTLENSLVKIDASACGYGGSYIWSKYMTFKVVGDKLTLCDEYSLYEFYRNDMYEYEETVSGKTFSSYEDFYSAVEKSGYNTKTHNHIGYEDAEFDVNNDDYTTAQCFKGNHIFTLLDSRGMLTAEQYGFIHDNTNLADHISEGRNSVENNVPITSEWKKSYIDFINSNEKGISSTLGFDSYQYYLINIDNDNIPELYIDYISYAGGAVVYSYQNGSIVKQHVKAGISYIEDKGLFLNNYYIIGCDNYYDEVYLLKDGTFSMVSSGYLQIYYSPEYKEEYVWDGKTVSKEEYDSMLSSYFEKSEAKSTLDLEPYDCNEIITAINNY